MAGRGRSSLRSMLQRLPSRDGRSCFIVLRFGSRSKNGHDVSLVAFLGLPGWRKVNSAQRSVAGRAGPYAGRLRQLIRCACARDHAGIDDSLEAHGSGHRPGRSRDRCRAGHAATGWGRADAIRNPFASDGGAGRKRTPGSLRRDLGCKSSHLRRSNRCPRHLIMETVAALFSGSSPALPWRPRTRRLWFAVGDRGQPPTGFDSSFPILRTGSWSAWGRRCRPGGSAVLGMLLGVVFLNVADGGSSGLGRPILAIHGGHRHLHRAVAAGAIAMYRPLWRRFVTISLVAAGCFAGCCRISPPVRCVRNASGMHTGGAYTQLSNPIRPWSWRPSGSSVAARHDPRCTHSYGSRRGRFRAAARRSVGGSQSDWPDRGQPD